MFFIVVALSFFLGILSLFAEKQHLSRNAQTITQHAQSLRNTCNTANEYEQQLRIFLEGNAFALTQSEQGLCAERKIFSPGLFLLGIACGILGALLYVLYFSFLQKHDKFPFLLLNPPKGRSMIALFSPSEGKNFLHYKFNLYPPLALESLSFAGADKSLRAQIIAIYLESLKDKKTLGQLFGTKRIDESMLTMCQNLCKSPTIEALRLYDGVAYQALDIENQEKHIQNLLFEYVIVFSNLFGVLKGGDKIPFYRLKQGTFVNGYELKDYYANFEHELDSWIGKEEVLDLRAEFYQKFYMPKTYHYIPRFYKNGKKMSHYAKLYRGHFLRQVASEFLLSGNKGWGLLDFEFEHFELIGVEKKDQAFILKYTITE